MVMTPKLVVDGRNLIDPKASRPYVCIRALKHFVAVPKAKYYWIEGQVREWPDKAGSYVRLRLAGGMAQYWDRRTRYYEQIRRPMIPLLEQLGCTPGGKPKTVYFCLWYEE